MEERSGSGASGASRHESRIKATKNEDPIKINPEFEMKRGGNSDQTIFCENLQGFPQEIFTKKFA